MFRSTLLASLALAAIVAPLMIAQPAAATTTNCSGDTGVCTQTTCKVDYRGNTTCVANTLAAPERESEYLITELSVSTGCPLSRA